MPLSTTYSKLFKTTKIPVFAPFYHAVSDEPLPHLQHLYPVRTTQQFEADLDFFLQHFQAISIDDLKSLDTLVLKKPPMLLSFDDGLSSFETDAMPILERKGVPAINFLNTGFVENKNMLFRFKTSLLIAAFEKKKNTAKHLAKKLNVAEHQIVQKLKSISFQNQALLEDCADILEIAFNSFLKKEKPYLELLTLNRLSKKGFHFGAHSVNHPLFHKLPLENQLKEASNSIQWLKENLNPKTTAFSFPFTDFGIQHVFFEKLREKQKIDFTFGCAGLKLDTVPNHFQRLPMEVGHKSAQHILNKNLLAFYLKKGIRKHKIKRT